MNFVPSLSGLLLPLILSLDFVVENSGHVYIYDCQAGIFVPASFLFRRAAFLDCRTKSISKFQSSGRRGAPKLLRLFFVFAAA
jgi:hypothetical protein